VELARPSESARADALRATGARAFRLLLAGQAVALIGGFAQSVALAWLLYRWTQSEHVLGIAGFVSAFPSAAVAPLGGALVDRESPRAVAFATQATTVAVASALAALLLMGRAGVGSILALLAVAALANGLHVPARQALIGDLLGEARALERGILVQSLVLDVARLVGPTLGGITARAFGEPSCFVLNALASAALLAALAAIRAPAASAAPAALPCGPPLPPAKPLRDPRVVAIVALVASVALASNCGTVLLPAIARRSLHGGVATLGLLTAASGVGAIAGALLRLARPAGGAPRPLLAAGAALSAIGLAGLVVARSVPAAVAALALAGAGVMVVMTTAHATLLRIAATERRGSVMSVFSLSFMAAAPVGSLAGGLAAAVLGTTGVLAAAAVLGLAGAAAFWARSTRLRWEAA
jgi:predicted MFS family arabinose efflux permease